MLYTMITLCPGLQSFSLVSLQGMLAFVTAVLVTVATGGNSPISRYP